MPTAAPRACAICGTPNCATHARRPWQHAVPVKRLRGRALQALRAEVYQRSPMCAGCRRHLAFTDRWALDHRVSLAAGGPDDRENLQILCEICHRSKTQDEATRARYGERLTHRGASK